MVNSMGKERTSRTNGINLNRHVSLVCLEQIASVVSDDIKACSPNRRRWESSTFLTVESFWRWTHRCGSIAGMQRAFVAQVHRRQVRSLSVVGQPSPVRGMVHRIDPTGNGFDGMHRDLPRSNRYHPRVPGCVSSWKILPIVPTVSSTRRTSCIVASWMRTIPCKLLKWKNCFALLFLVTFLVLFRSLYVLRRDVSPKEREGLARLAYAIFCSEGQTNSIIQLLASIYDERNVYVIHLDQKASEIESRFLQDYLRPRFPTNVKIMESSSITWGGVTMLLGTMRAIAILLKDSSVNWDYVINLSASDMPLMPQISIMELLAQVAPGTSFMTAAPFDDNATKGIYDRRVGMVVDPALANAKGATRFQSISDRRQAPVDFMPYKGGGWFILHRSFAAASIDFSEIWPARLLLYFGNWFASDESYFQTLACASRMDRSLHFAKEDWRYIRWTGIVHPDTLKGTDDLRQAIESGALFARKFEPFSIERDVLQELISRHPHAATLKGKVDRVKLRDLQDQLVHKNQSNWKHRQVQVQQHIDVLQDALEKQEQEAQRRLRAIPVTPLCQ